ncbi:MAG TPA: CHAD domain-containing protein [Trebonia sp.]|jgi:CHAD domain-containing protein
MTPGLAAFIATENGGQTWDDVVAEVLAALARGFAVVPERDVISGARRRTWFDTFDWRLYRAGLTLQYAAARRGGELRLSSQEAVGDVVQPVSGWRASYPHPLRNLPDGQVAARITSLVEPRALLPMATASGVATMRRLLNDDGKTVARLLVESLTVSTGDHEPLPPRLTITEVRGYPGQARRAVRIVEDIPGIRPATEPVLVDALRAVGRRPGDYSSKVSAKITPGMPAAQAAAVILLRLVDIIEANVPGVLRDTDVEFLHDLRVAVRRTRSALKLFGDALLAPLAARGSALTADDLARFAAEFKWVGDLTTPTRDLDVHLLDFEETAQALLAAKPDDLEPFRAYLAQRRLREFRALTRGLRSSRFVNLMRDWRQRLTTIRDASKRPARGATGRSGRSSSAAGETAGTLAAQRTRRAFHKVAKRGAAITPASPHDSLHDLRKRCKELRYALEFFAPLLPPAGYAEVLTDLKRLQDCLGEFQDTEVQIGEIRALATNMLAAGEAPAVTLLAMGEVTAGLAARQQRARADFERRFAAFAGAEGQRRMALLLRGGSE